MKDESARDEAIENVLGQKLRARATAGNGCPDAEIVAAYFDRTLPPQERSRWESHFDSCAACQQRIAALVRMDEAGEASMTNPSAKSAVQPRKGFGLRWAWAAPVLLVVLVGGLWYTGEFDKVLNRHAETQQAAPHTVATPSKPAETPAAATKDTGTTSTQEPKGEVQRQQPARKAPETAAAADQLKQAANAPVPATAAPARSAAQAPAIATPSARMGIMAERKAKENEAASASTATGVIGAPAPAPLEASQPAPPPAARQEMTKADNETATRSEAAGLAAAPTAAPPENAVMKKSLAAVGGSTQAAPAPSDKTQAAPRMLFSSSQALGGMARTSGFRYASSPGATTRDGLNLPASIWRIGRSGLIQKQTAQGQWETKPSGVAIDLLDINFPSREVGWAVGQDGTVLRSASAGESWGRVTSPTEEDLVRVRATSAESAEVTTRSGAVFATTDGAATWTRVGTAR